jgi:alkylation response protein AidB-like acyl-CoA dehydrogenase
VISFELTAMTPPGERFVQLAEEHAEVFATRAEKHDRENTFPFENFEDLQKSKLLAAAVPEEYGGLGVESLHDLMVGLSRLGRGDGSTAIASNMHITGAAVVVRMMRRARAAGEDKTVNILEDLLVRLGAGELIMCFPNTERGTDLATPMAELTPTEDGYLLNGRKIFGTISPAAQLFFPTVRLPNGAGGYLLGSVMVSRDNPGLELVDNWDAMGMRGSGSGDIVFKDCFVPKHLLFAVRDNYGKIGRGFSDFALTANVPLISSFLGIAEAARDLSIKTLKSQRKGLSAKLLAERIPIQQLVAEMEIDISTCRALIDRLGRISDEFLEQYPYGEAPVDDGTAIMKEVQCMKHVVNRKAIEVVDRAMIVCGGGAYMSKHPLSRLYRDARAGPFMQPFAPYEALEYIGKVALGFDPILDR